MLVESLSEHCNLTHLQFCPQQLLAYNDEDDKVYKCLQVYRQGPEPTAWDNYQTASMQS